MAEQKRLTYFVADAHLGLDVNNPFEREGRFVSFLRGIDPSQTSAIYLLGDIFDFWYEYRDVVPKGYARVFGTLQDLMDAGVDVYFFVGNHDIWAYHYFEEMGMKRLTQPAVIEIAGKTFCLGHGDGLGPSPLGYRILRWIFHNRVLQFLFSFLHPWIAFRLGINWSQNSRLARHEKYVFKGEEEPLYKFAEEFSTKRHVDYFIFGHFHADTELTLPCGAKLVVLGDWIDCSVYRYFDGISGILGYSPNKE